MNRQQVIEVLNRFISINELLPDDRSAIKYALSELSNSEGKDELKDRIVYLEENSKKLYDRIYSADHRVRELKDRIYSVYDAVWEMPEKVDRDVVLKLLRGEQV